MGPNLSGLSRIRKGTNMKPEIIMKILDAHGVPYFTADGRIYADSMLADTKPFEVVEDLTGWTCARLYGWLGY